MAPIACARSRFSGIRLPLLRYGVERPSATYVGAEQPGGCAQRRPPRRSALREPAATGASIDRRADRISVIDGAQSQRMHASSAVRMEHRRSEAVDQARKSPTAAFHKHRIVVGNTHRQVRHGKTRGEEEQDKLLGLGQCAAVPSPGKPPADPDASARPRHEARPGPSPQRRGRTPRSRSTRSALSPHPTASSSASSPRDRTRSEGSQPAREALGTPGAPATIRRGRGGRRHV